MLVMRSTGLTNQPSDCLYQLWLRSGEEMTPCARRDIDHLPWRVREETELAGLGLHITAEHVFLNERVLTSRFRLENRSEEAIATECVYNGLATGDRFCREPRVLRNYGQPGDLPLQPGETAEHILVTELTVANYACRTPKRHDIDPSNLDFDAAIEASKAAFLKRENN